MLPRFRKKSDAKRPSVSLTQHVQAPQSPPLPSAASLSRQQLQAPLTLLPASDDFRTSLILPDLSRRFSLLRQPDGRPVGIEDVREKFAEQRNHGSVNVITEEEEEYVINYLKGAGHMPGGVVDDRHTADDRNAFPTSIPTTPSDAYGEPVVPHSAFHSTFPHSPPTTTKAYSPLSPAFSTSSSRGYPSSPLTPSPPTSRASNGSYSSKRLSNNLFGSGRYKDQSYMRSASKKQISDRSLRELAQQHATGSNQEDAGRSQADMDEGHTNLIEDHADEGHEDTIEVVGHAVSSPMGAEEPLDGEDLSGDMFRPMTPPGSRTESVEVLNLAATRSLQDDARSTTPQGSPQYTNGRSSRSRGGPVVFTPGQVHRASLALEEVIRNFEQDDSAEEQILTPRSNNGIYAHSTTNGFNTHPWVKSPSPPVIRSLLPEGKLTHQKTMGSASLQPHRHGERQIGTEPNAPSTPPGAQYVYTQPSHQYVKSSPSGSARHPWQGDEPPPPSSPGARAVSPLSPGSPRVPGYKPGMQRPISPPEPLVHEESIDKTLNPTPSSPRKAISTGLQQRLNALPIEARSGGAVTKAVQSPNRDGMLRSGVGGSTSPYGSSTSPRAHGAIVKIVPPASFNTNPINPPPRSSSLRKRPAVFDPANGRQDTDRSTSSSSVLPDTSSSSSLGSLASPSAAEEQSDATSTLISSDNNTLRGGSLKSPLSPGFPPQQDISQPNLSSTANGHSSPIGILKGSTRLVDQRLDPSHSQLHTGHHSEQSPVALVDKTMAQIPYPTQTGLGGQTDITDSKEIERGLSSSTSSTTSTSSRLPSSIMRKPGMSLPAPQLLRTWSDHRPMLSPAFPDSPLVQDFCDSGYANTKNSHLAALPSPLQSFQESQKDDIDRKLNNAASTRSETPVTTARSPTPKGRVTTPVSSQPLASPSLKSSFLRHQHQRGASESTGEGISENMAVKVNGTSRFNGNGTIESTSAPARAGITRTFSPKPVLLNSHSRNMSSTSSVGPNASLPPRSPSTSSRPREGMVSPQLSLQPIFNTSSSSLDSMGSSFHSIEGDRKSSLQLEEEGSTKDTQDRTVAAEDDATESDYEDLLGLWGGLTRKDVAAIHDRLVGAATLKVSNASSPPVSSPRPTSPPFVTRRPSHTRQQSGSISQSLKSMSQGSEISSQKDSVLRDNSTKADALLRAMVQSLPPLEPSSLAIPASFVPATGPSTSDTSPASLDSFKAVLPVVPKAEDASVTKLPSGVTKPSPIPSLNDPDLRKRALTEALFGDASQGSGPSPGTSEPKDHPYANKELTLEDLEPAGRAKSTPSPRIPDEDLVAAVTRKAAAATEALKNPTGKSDTPLKRQDTKRINGRLISTPQLLSSTTSFDTVPIASGQVPNPSTPSLASPDVTKSGDKPGKLSLRIKKLREKLKSSRAFVPNGEELTPWTYEARSASPNSTRQGSISTLLIDAVPRQSSPQPEPIAASSVSHREPQPPSPSPTTPRAEVSSPGPGIKGFMSRLRSNSKRDASDLSSPLHGNSTTTSFLSRSSSKKKSISPKPSTSSLLSSPKRHVASEHTIEEEKEREEQEPHVVDLTSPREEPSELWLDISTPDPLEVNHDDTAVRQLFEAASNLGLDRGALTELLARSTSVSSKTGSWSPAVTRSNSVMTATTPNTAAPKASDGVLPGDGLKKALSSRVGALLSRVVEHPGGLAASVNVDQVVIRRTLIFPSDGESSLIRKGSVATTKTGRKKRGSTTSVQSSQSLQDRSPTPPPKRTSKRFSKDPSPPIPSLPSQFTSPKGEGTLGIGLLGQSARSHQSTSSAYGSLFDMYGEESPTPSVPPSPGSVAGGGVGQALEVVELSNGEVVWSVVDAMRNDIVQDDDGSSLYQSRRSTTSETSYTPRDGVQVLFKEHRRMGSKGSTTSAMSAVSSFRKHATNRPETKIFFSSAAHIGRLIESMSRGADAGSFNIIPAPPESPSPPDASLLARFGGKNSPALSMTDNSYSVEDRLDHLLKLTSRGHS